MAVFSNIPQQKQGFAFGLEIELSVRPKFQTEVELQEAGWDASVQPDSRDEARKAMNRSLIRTRISDHLRTEHLSVSLINNTYNAWTVVDEPSLDESGPFWRAQIVSRVLSTDEEWQVEVSQVFQILSTGWSISTRPGCAMHVHVSKGVEEKDRYTIDDIRRILKATAIFDDAITKIMPPHRKMNPWAMPNFQSERAPAFWEKKYADVSAQTWAPLFSIFDAITQIGTPHMEMSRYRYTSWNFSYLATQCGTIEFRRPPSAQTESVARHWIGVALGFISQALNTDFNQYTSSKTHPSVQELLGFLAQGTARLDLLSQRCLDPAAIRENGRPPTTYTPARLQEIKNKMAEKDQAGSPFATKMTMLANSRGNTASGSSGMR
ncbi:putative amidoligase enzyme-domain-containing protein [Nemania sp. FL0916]|nr:putative amidoligase enzyme-domain-containing protein [Nemania sp. FL0916]